MTGQTESAVRILPGDGLGHSEGEHRSPAGALDVPDSLWSVEQQLHGVSDRVLVAVAAPEYAGPSHDPRPRPCP